MTTAHTTRSEARRSAENQDPSQAVSAPKRYRPRRLTAGSVVPIMLAVLAAGFGYAALQDRSAMVNVAVAAVAIPAGSLVDVGDTRFVHVHATDQVLAGGLLSPSRFARPWTAVVRINQGELITRGEVTEPSTAGSLGSMSIEVPVERAAGGTISVGDLVDVIAADGTGGAYYVAQGLRVLSVAENPAGSGVLGGASGSYFVVVAVSKRDALRITAALGASAVAGGSGAIEVVRSNGEAPATQLTYGMTPAGVSGSPNSSGPSGAPSAGTGTGTGGTSPSRIGRE
ncbi:MAG TPA: hypothetical protein VED59_06970 [Acidimicrobiales bacterium]|nr:hypothetical protein [Acidimicrobiales bacterium]